MEFPAPEIFPCAGTNLDNNDKACFSVQTTEMDRDQSVFLDEKLYFTCDQSDLFGFVNGVENRAQDRVCSRYPSVALEDLHRRTPV